MPIGEFLGNNRGRLLGSAVGSAAGPVGSIIGGEIGGSSDRKIAEAAKLSAYQTGLSTEQQAEADRIKAELEAQGRPEMQAQVQRQQEIADMAQRYAREGMPTAQRELAEGNIQQNAAQVLGGATSLGGGLRAAAGVQQSTANQYRGLNAQDAAMAQQNQGQYLNALGSLGQAEGQAEQYNKLLPYEQKLAEMQALRGSSIQNQQAALGFNYQDASNTYQSNMNLLGAGIGAAGQFGGSAIGALA
jgi:hypothetical protein